MRVLLACMTSLVMFVPLGCVATGGFRLPAAHAPRYAAEIMWPDVGAVVLEDVATLEYRMVDGLNMLEPQLVLDHRRKIQVLRPNGLGVATVEIPLDGYSKITQLVARSVDIEGHETLMPASGWQLEERHTPEEQAAGLKTLQFSIPGATVGGLLEYRYQRVLTDATLLQPWVFGDNLPVRYAELGWVASDTVKVDFRCGNGDKPSECAPQKHLDENSGKERWVFVARNLPAFYHEPLMPHLSRLTPWVAVALRSEYLQQKPLRFETWQDVADSIERKMHQVEAAPQALAGSLVERIHAVQKSLTPLKLPGLGVVQPVTAHALLQGYPACSRDAAALLVQSLQDLGLHAYPALVTGLDAPPLLDDMPAVYPFSRALVAIEATNAMLADNACTAGPLLQGPLCHLSPGGYLFVDPLCKTCGFGVLPTRYAGMRALVLTPKAAKWVEIETPAPQRDALLQKSKFVMEIDGFLIGSTGSQAYHAAAATIREALAQTKSELERVAFLQKSLLGGTTGPVMTFQEIDKGASNALDSPWGMHARLRGRAQRKDFAHYWIRGIDLVGRTIPEEWHGSRRTPAELLGPRWYETIAEVQLPLGYTTEVQAPLSLVRDFAEYTGAFSLSGNVLQFTRRLVIKQMRLTPDMWPAFQDFIKEIETFESQGPMVWAAH